MLCLCSVFLYLFFYRFLLFNWRFFFYFFFHRLFYNDNFLLFNWFFHFSRLRSLLFTGSISNIGSLGRTLSSRLGGIVSNRRRRLLRSCICDIWFRSLLLSRSWGCLFRSLLLSRRRSCLNICYDFLTTITGGWFWSRRRFC